MLRRLTERNHNRARDGQRVPPLLRHWAALLGIVIGAAWLTTLQAETIEEMVPQLSFQLRSIERGPNDHPMPDVLWKANVSVVKYSHSAGELVEATVWVPPEVAQKLGQPDDSKVITLTVIYHGSHKKGHCSWQAGDWVCGTQ